MPTIYSMDILIIFTIPLKVTKYERKKLQINLSTLLNSKL